MKPEHIAMAIGLPGGDAMGPAADEGKDAPLRAAMEDLHASMKSGDIDGMMSAFKTAMMCGEESEPEPEAPTDEEEPAAGMPPG